MARNNTKFGGSTAELQIRLINLQSTYPYVLQYSDDLSKKQKLFLMEKIMKVFGGLKEFNTSYSLIERNGKNEECIKPYIPLIVKTREILTIFEGQEFIEIRIGRIIDDLLDVAHAVRTGYFKDGTCFKYLNLTSKGYYDIKYNLCEFIKRLPFVWGVFDFYYLTFLKAYPAVNHNVIYVYQRIRNFIESCAREKCSEEERTDLKALLNFLISNKSKLTPVSEEKIKENYVLGGKKYCFFIRGLNGNENVEVKLSESQCMDILNYMKVNSIPLIPAVYEEIVSWYFKLRYFLSSAPSLLEAIMNGKIPWVSLAECVFILTKMYCDGILINEETFMLKYGEFLTKKAHRKDLLHDSNQKFRNIFSCLNSSIKFPKAWDSDEYFKLSEEEQEQLRNKIEKLFPESFELYCRKEVEFWVEELNRRITQIICDIECKKMSISALLAQMPFKQPYDPELFTRLAKYFNKNVAPKDLDRFWEFKSSNNNDTGIGRKLAVGDSNNELEANTWQGRVLAYAKKTINIVKYIKLKEFFDKNGLIVADQDLSTECPLEDLVNEIKRRELTWICGFGIDTAIIEYMKANRIPFTKDTFFLVLNEYINWAKENNILYLPPTTSSHFGIKSNIQRITGTTIMAPTPSNTLHRYIRTRGR